MNLHLHLDQSPKLLHNILSRLRRPSHLLRQHLLPQIQNFLFLYLLDYNLHHQMFEYLQLQYKYYDFHYLFRQLMYHHIQVHEYTN